jgi:hypothetical protein
MHQKNAIQQKVRTEEKEKKGLELKIQQETKLLMKRSKQRTKQQKSCTCPQSANMEAVPCTIYEKAIYFILS